MLSSKVDGAQSIKVYLRLTSKYAKIVYLQSTTSTDQLYLLASQNYNVPIQEMHLFYQGQLLPTSTTVTLQDNAIIHIVRLNTLSKQIITISIKMIGSSQNIITLDIAGTMLIGLLAKEKLCPYFGVKMEEILLVYLGRQLIIQHSFQQEQVQDGSQILCLLLSHNPQQHQCNKIERSDSYKVKIPIQRLQTPQPPKDIYPKSDFAINIPQGIHTSNNLNLIFDSKVKRFSSIQNVELHPEEIIPQQESNFQADFVKYSHSHQSKSQFEEEFKARGSCLSQQWLKRSPKCSQMQKSNVQQPKMIDFKSNDVIYAANFHMLRDSNIMGDLIGEYKDRLKLKIEKEQYKI